jgi:Fe2+ or Zn2+ uptake regulation protein
VIRKNSQESWGFTVKPTIQTLSEILLHKNIRPSQQRIKVLEYLMTHHNHPSVEMIYNQLIHEIPTLSKATVYNTLNLFIEAGLARVLDIAENEARYDILMETHGHFKCVACGTIHNFRIEEKAFESEDLSDFVIHDRNVYFKGLCPKCSKNEADKNTEK